MNYWTIIDNSHAGPFTIEQLSEMNLTPESLIWHDGLPDWTPARDIPALAVLFAAPAEAPEPPEPQGQPTSQAPDNADAAPSPEPMDTPTTAPGTEDLYNNPRQDNPQSAPNSYYGSPNGYYGAPNGPQSAPNGPQQAGPNGYYPYQPQGECPPTYLGWSIAVTILCCLVFGVAGIICSAQVRTAWQRGDLRRAQRMSDWAQWCIILSIVGGLLWIPIQLAFSSFSLGDF